MDGLNVLAGGLDNLFKNHPALGTATVLAGGAAGALVLGSVGGSLVKAALLRGQGAVAEAVTAGVLAATPGGEAAVAARLAPTGVGAVAPTLAASAAKAAKSAAKWGGISTAIFGGMEAIGVLADKDADKPRDLTRIGVTTGGSIAGMAAGAALGSVVPVIGTAIGGLIGGILGSMGGSYGAGMAFDALWAPADSQRSRGGWRGRGFVDPRIIGNEGQPDLLAGSGAFGGLANARNGRLEIGTGTLDVNVMVTQQPGGGWAATALPSVARQPTMIRINPGSTNPAGYANGVD
jgi:hypothetical protein